MEPTSLTSLRMVGSPSAMSRHLPIDTDCFLTTAWRSSGSFGFGIGAGSVMPISLARPRSAISCASTPPMYPPPMSPIFFNMAYLLFS